MPIVYKTVSYQVELNPSERDVVAFLANHVDRKLGVDDLVEYINRILSKTLNTVNKLGKVDR